MCATPLYKSVHTASAIPPYCWSSCRCQLEVLPDLVPAQPCLARRQHHRRVSHAVLLHRLPQLLLHGPRHRPGVLAARVLDVLISLRQHHDVLGVVHRALPAEYRTDLAHDPAVLLGRAVPRVDQVEDHPKVRPEPEVLVHEVRPVLPLLLRDLGEAEAREVDDVEGVAVRRAGDVVAEPDLALEVGLVVHGKVVELLRLARRLARERE
mmetsp:Transcript_2563/g.5188  ORF Transcript_2563/g.5188 Transcript_2563/m.5188 type:complete len:209 (+) Transcript_2563:399-1025(+)